MIERLAVLSIAFVVMLPLIPSQPHSKMERERIVLLRLVGAIGVVMILIRLIGVFHGA